MEIDGASGIIRVRPDRLARTRQAVLGLLKRGRASAGALSVLVGHCTWGMILRRDVLSIFNAVYRFMGSVGPQPVPLWASVVRELSAAVALIPLWSASTRARWYPRVYASDASPFGKGVCVKEVSPTLSSEVGRVAERWRYRYGDAVRARSHALDDAARDDAALPVPSGFFEVPEAIYGVEGWKTIHSSRHTRRGCDILQYEAEALGFSVHHVSRTLGAHHHRVVCIVVNLALALSLGKGRSGSRRLLRALRRIAAVALACGLRLLVRWAPSERNVADRPSREGFFVGPSFEDVGSYLVSRRPRLPPGR